VPTGDLNYADVYETLLTQPIIRVCRWLKLNPKKIEKMGAFFYSVRRRHDVTYGLLCLALIELIASQGKLHYIFYVLPFYFIIILWKDSTLFLHHKCVSMNEIIHTRYYLLHQAIYAFTSELDDELIYAYIRNGCCIPYTSDPVRAKALWHLYFDLSRKMSHQNEHVRVRYNERVDYDTCTVIDPGYIKKIYHPLSVKPDDPELLKEDDPVILKAKGSVRIYINILASPFEDPYIALKDIPPQDILDKLMLIEKINKDAPIFSQISFCKQLVTYILSSIITLVILQIKL